MRAKVLATFRHPTAVGYVGLGNLGEFSAPTPTFISTVSSHPGTDPYPVSSCQLLPESIFPRQLPFPSRNPPRSRPFYFSLCRPFATLQPSDVSIYSARIAKLKAKFPVSIASARFQSTHESSRQATSDVQRQKLISRFPVAQ